MEGCDGWIMFYEPTMTDIYRLYFLAIYFTSNGMDWENYFRKKNYGMLEIRLSG